jgi:aminoglycoside phosphotransferase (APT) family kinase protein
VYALDDDRVLRVLHAGGTESDIRRRQDLVDELARSPLPFALPSVIEVGELDGRTFAIERRLPGRSVMDELRNCEGEARARLIEGHLDAAAALGDLHLEPRSGYGELIIDDAIVTSTWRAYLEQRAARNLARSTPDLQSIDAVALAAALPEPAAAAFVHVDAFAGNMLTDGTRITAVLDIGPTSLAGDRRLDPVSAVVYLASPDISPAANRSDVDVATSWLRAHGLHDWFEPAQRWLAAFWSFAVDDPRVLEWCRSVLLDAG